MPNKARWIADDTPLSEEAVEQSFRRDSHTRIVKNAYLPGQWVQGNCAASTWIVLEGACKVVLFEDESHRPLSEEAFWRCEGWTLQAGDKLETEFSRYVLTVLPGESEVVIMTVFDLTAIRETGALS